MRLITPIKGPCGRLGLRKDLGRDARHGREATPTKIDR